jgi:site-specific DNA-cytosine methylase
MGILNSTLIDWYFKLTSSNNHINNYEIDNFPIPVNFAKKNTISDLVKEYIQTQCDDILQKIDALVYEAYGIGQTGQTTEENDNEGEKFVRASVFTSEQTVITAFQNDLRQIIPGVAESEICAILDGQATAEDVCFQKKPDISKFEKRVLENIEKKYKQLYAGVVLNHTTFKLSDLDLEMIRPIPQGGSWKDIPQETVQKSKRLVRITKTGGRTTLYGRIDYEKPSYTITTYFNRPGNGTYVHPIHQRVLSVREAARFQCFPDDYLFCGNKSDLLKQVGNAVPPIMAKAIAKKLVKLLFSCVWGVEFLI